MDWHNELTINSVQSADGIIEQQRAEAEGVLKKEWGNAYDANVELANKVVNKFGVAESLIAKGIANDPDVIRMFSEIGKATMEDSFITGEANNTPNNAMEEINRIMGDPKHPYFNPDHPAHGDAVNKMIQLRNQAHPEIK
jgi:ATP-dependent exoDNAse (exonuclease V) alpha subunit